MAKLNIVFGAVTNPLKRGLGKIKEMLGGLKGAVLGGLATGLGLVAYGIKEIVQASAKMEQTQVAFEVLLGSAEKATALIKQLRGFANVTPFDTNSVIEASRGLVAAGSSGKVLEKEMRMIGEVAAGTGNKIGAISSIYAKLKRMGRLTFEEINQLTNSGAVTMEELYNATGKTKYTFRSFVESGRASFSTLVKIFEASTGEGGRFNGMMERLSETLGGKWSIAVGKWQMALADMGKDSTGPIGRIVDALIKGIDALAKWKGLFEDIASAAERVANVVMVMSGGEGESMAKSLIKGDSDAAKASRKFIQPTLEKQLKYETYKNLGDLHPMIANFLPQAPSSEDTDLMKSIIQTQRSSNMLQSLKDEAPFNPILPGRE